MRMSRDPTSLKQETHQEMK